MVNVTTSDDNGGVRRPGPVICALALCLLPAAPVGAEAPEAPAQLGCLLRHYTGQAAFVDGRWFVVLPGGARHPWAGAPGRPLDRRIEDPAPADTFAIPYPTGPIAPVDDAARDPGRLRFLPLFAATYGDPPRSLARIRFFGHTLKVHPRLVAPLERVTARLAPQLAATLRGHLVPPAGAFARRNIAGTERRSAHAYGVALDLNAARSHYWRWQKEPGPPRWRSTIPAAIVAAFEAEGFIWGGRWYHYDTMHFEYRPELVGEGACR